MMYLVIILMTVLGAIAGLFFKKTSANKSIKGILTTKYFFLGSSIYLIAALLNIYVLIYLPYSVVLPLTSITYIWTLILAYFTLKEFISIRKVFGVALIIIGAFLVAL
ncbi:MAG: EamA family transporter [Sporolactobacillus sp.]